MKENHVCECCGSENTVVKTTSRFFPIPFSDTLEYKNKVIHCNDCDEDVDLDESQSVDSFLSTENPDYTTAIKKSIDTMLSDLQKMNISLSHIERSFDIPARTLSKWHNDRNLPSAAALSFLRILRTFPWVLKVAEKNFDDVKSHHIALKNEMQHFFKGIEGSGKNIERYFAFGTNYISCKMEIRNNESPKMEFNNTATIQNEKQAYSVEYSEVPSL
jgi:DNA-binding transcriptional regulator YiaG